MLGAILLVILLIIFLILLLKVNIIVTYEESVSVYLKILFLKIKIFPSEKRPKLKDFSAKGINKKIRKDQEKIDKQLTKENKKKKQTVKDKAKNISDTLKLVLDIVSSIYKRFFRYLRVKVARLELTVATDDAAKTAIEYGLAVQGVQYIVAVLENITNFSVERNGRIHVDCDFCSEKTHFELDISFSLRVWHIALILLRAGLAFVMDATNKNNSVK